MNEDTADTHSERLGLGRPCGLMETHPAAGKLSMLITAAERGGGFSIHRRMRKKKVQLISVGGIYRGAGLDSSHQWKQAVGDTFCKGSRALEPLT